MVDIAFDALGDEATYTIASTGETRDVTVIPIDEAETWEAKRGDAKVTGTKIIARLYRSQFPDGWEGPAVNQNGKGADVLVMDGRRYRVTPIRDELNGVIVTELEVTKR